MYTTCMTGIFYSNTALLISFSFQKFFGQQLSALHRSIEIDFLMPSLCKTTTNKKHSKRLTVWDSNKASAQTIKTAWSCGVFCLFFERQQEEEILDKTDVSDTQLLLYDMQPANKEIRDIIMIMTKSVTIVSQ